MYSLGACSWFSCLETSVSLEWDRGGFLPSENQLSGSFRGTCFLRRLYHWDGIDAVFVVLS